jgi:hypothetical protein
VTANALQVSLGQKCSQGLLQQQQQQVHQASTLVAC